MKNKQQTWSNLSIFFYRAFLIAAPLNLYGLGTGIFNYRFSRIFLVFTLISMFVDSSLRNRIGNIKFHVYDILLFSYVILAIYSGVYVDNYTAYIIRLLGLLECVLIFYVIRLQTMNIFNLIRSVEIYVFSSIIVIFASLYQLYTIFYNPEKISLPFSYFLLHERYEIILTEAGHFGGVIDNFSRIYSTFGEPNMLAGYCASIIPFIIAITLFKLSKNNFVLVIPYILIGFGTILCMIATVSKSGLISSFFAVFILFYLLHNTLSKKQKRSLNIFLIGCFTAVVLYVSSANEIFIQRFDLDDSGHLEYRLNAYNTFVEKPLLGQGFGNYEFISAHTLPLTAMIELGFLGGVIVFIISLFPLFCIQKKDRKLLNKADPNYLLFFYACYSSYVAIFIGLYLYDYWIHPFTWITIGLLISIISQVKSLRSKVQSF
jgi:hypothetical protein